MKKTGRAAPEPPPTAPTAEQQILSVKELVSKFKVPFSMSMASRRNTGKTFFIGHLINELVMSRKVAVVLVLSNTAGVNSDYSFLPRQLRQPFKESTIERLLARQKAVPQADRQEVLLVCDDVLSDKDAENSRLIKKLFVMGRHFNISIILASQSANGFILTPTIKNNSDWILFSRLNRHHLISLWEALSNIDKAEFVTYAETHNRDWTFLCVDNTTQSVDPREFLLLTRALSTAPKKSKHRVYTEPDASEEGSSAEESD